MIAFMDDEFFPKILSLLTNNVLWSCCLAMKYNVSVAKSIQINTNFKNILKEFMNNGRSGFRTFVSYSIESLIKIIKN